VQETLLAALSAEASFQGRANLRAWLTGILKHKIVVAVRRASRESPRWPVRRSRALERAGVPDARAPRARD
jgi:DNA-directed RNA polymerase specialized sigma24 family protein